MTPLIVWTLVGLAWLGSSALVTWGWWVLVFRRQPKPPPSPWSTPGYRGNLRRRLIGQNVEGP